MKTSEILEIGADLSKIVLTQKEAYKASKIPKEEIKVSQKVTAKNFYKNSDFWKITGSIIVAGATGQYIDIIGLLESLINIF